MGFFLRNSRPKVKSIVTYSQLTDSRLASVSEMKTGEEMSLVNFDELRLEVNAYSQYLVFFSPPARPSI